MAGHQRARALYRRLPPPARRILVVGYRAWNMLPFTLMRRRQNWLAKEYSAYGRTIRKDLFIGIARFCHINRPKTGYYFEFGSHEANTMRLAWDSFQHLFDFTYVAFDSFEGLPAIGEIDRQDIWSKGKLKTSEEEFLRTCLRHGVPREKLITVKGFYDQSLNEETEKRFSPDKAAVIYVDCDLYESTVPVLRFIKPFLQEGTILVFDDWNCFNADPQRGERRAFSEFLTSNPQLRFETFAQTTEMKAFVFVGEHPR